MENAFYIGIDKETPLTDPSSQEKYFTFYHLMCIFNFLHLANESWGLGTAQIGQCNFSMIP